MGFQQKPVWVPRSQDPRLGSRAYLFAPVSWSWVRQQPSDRAIPGEGGPGKRAQRPPQVQSPALQFTSYVTLVHFLICEKKNCED